MKVKNVIKTGTLLTLFLAFVLPILEYASPVWSSLPLSCASRIDNVQIRFMKLLYKKTFGYYSTDMNNKELLSCFVLKNLVSRREIASLLNIFDTISSRLSNRPQLDLIRMNIPRPIQTCSHLSLYHIVAQRLSKIGH